MNLPRPFFAGTVFVAVALSAAGQKVAPPPAGVQPKLPAVQGASVPLLDRATLDAPARQAVIAEDLVLKATLKIERPGPALAGREVKFTVDGAAACAGTTDAAGVASCHFKIPPMPQGFHAYAAQSAAGGGITSARAEAKLLVGKAQTKLTLVAGGSGDAPLAPGGTIQIAAQLARALDGSGIDGKPVSFEINGAAAGNATTVNGFAARQWQVPAGATGAQKFEAFFVTDDSYVGTSAQVTKGVSRKAYLNVLIGPGGTVGKPITVRGQITRGQHLPGIQSAGDGLSGRALMFIFDGYDPKANRVAPAWNWTATTDANGVATVTNTPLENASQVRLRLEAPTDGWSAAEVARPLTVALSETQVTAPGIAGRIGTSATLNVHVARQTDGAPRKSTRILVTKFDQTNFQTPISFFTNASGDATTSLPISSQMGIGNHTLTVHVDGDGACKGKTATVALTVQPSA